MLKKMALATVVTFLAVIALTAQPNEGAAQKQSSANQSQASVVLAPPQQQNHAADNKTGTADYPPKWYTAFENPDGMLVLVGIVTCAVIGWQSFETRRAAKASQEQARLTRETVIQTERPRIKVRTFYFKEFSDPQEPSGVLAGSMLMGQFYIVNLGGTRATIKEILYQFFITGEPNLPAKRPWEGESGVECESIFEAGQSKPHTFGRMQPLDSGEAFQIFTGKKKLYLMGWIDYVDGLDIRRTTRFCRLYDPKSYRFVAVDDPEYESAD